jgi:phage repressor protein C with HTH and peptisase S24 domain
LSTFAGMDGGEIIAALKRLHVPHDRIAAAIDRERSVATKMLNGQRRIQAAEIAPLLALVEEFQSQHHPLGALTLPNGPLASAEAQRLAGYAAIAFLPAYAGEFAREVMVPRLMLDKLQARADDLRMMTVRGDAMAPRFCHGDTLCIDLRDRSAAQGGAFCIRVDDDHLVRIVQRLPGPGLLRASAVNPDFPPADVDADHLQIVGRVVWFARFL